jgi:hypothetical protein
LIAFDEAGVRRYECDENSLELEALKSQIIEMIENSED